MKKKSCSGKTLWLSAAAMLAALLALSWLFPVTGDDWYRETVGRGLHSVSDLIALLVQNWKTVNPRLLGNTLAYCAGARPVLRMLLRGSLMTALMVMAAKNTGALTAPRLLLCGAFVLALPQDMFAQIYPWAAGFFNYVPPVITILLIMLLGQPVFEGTVLHDSAPRAAAAFLLGCAGQLFIEHQTVYACLAAGFLAAVYALERRRCSFTLLAAFAGTVVGAAILFMSPAYRTLGDADSAYTVESGAAGLLQTAQENAEQLLDCLPENAPVLYLSFAVVCPLLFALRNRKRRTDCLLLLLAEFSALWYLLSDTLKLSAPFGVRVLLAVLWWCSVLLATACWVPQTLYRRRAVFFQLSAVVAAAPLLLVSPIGPRCFFFSYLLLLLAAGNGLQAVLERRKIGRRASVFVSALAFACVWGYDLYLFIPIHQAENAREATIAQAMARGDTEISITPYPNGDYLWEPQSQKLGVEYFYETPHDILFTILEDGEGGS